MKTDPNSGRLVQTTEWILAWGWETSEEGWPGRTPVVVEVNRAAQLFIVEQTCSNASHALVPI